MYALNIDTIEPFSAAAGAASIDRRPLIAHIIFRLDVGGLENGLVNLINGMPEERFRHAVICIDDYTTFRSRIRRDDVEVVAIRKKEGTDLGALLRLYRTFKRIKPDIVHSRNLAGLDALVPAWLAGVPRRIHGEHGWDVNDLGGASRKLQWLRRLHVPMVHRYVALSGYQHQYLVEQVGVRRDRVHRICNGVDVARFTPRGSTERGLPPWPTDFAGREHVVIGTVGRLQPVKDPINLVDAFSAMVRNRPDLASRARLVIVGDGPLRASVSARLDEHHIRRLTWMPGERHDVPEILRSLDVFVQPSLAEGISNTILEAMASGIPVVATRVGGNAELVVESETGMLVPSRESTALARALTEYADDPELRGDHGMSGRRRAETRFSIETMIESYLQTYEDLLRPWA